MNKDRVKGAIDEVVGSAKRKAGELTGDTPLQIKGLRTHGAMRKMRSVELARKTGCNTAQAWKQGVQRRRANSSCILAVVARCVAGMH